MGNLLKDAIADAKQIREIALQNAKMALEEAFRPQLQSMLSTKIQNEVEGEDEIEDVPVEEPVADEVPVEEPVDVEVPAEEPVADEVPVEVPAEEPVADEVPLEEPVEEPEVEENYGETGLDDEDDLGMGIGGDDDEEDLDLEAIIRELETESEGEEEMEEPELEDENVEFDPITGEEPDSVDGLDTESKAVAVSKAVPGKAVGQGEPKLNVQTDVVDMGTNTEGGDKLNTTDKNTTNMKESADNDEDDKDAEVDLEEILREIESEEQQMEQSEVEEENVRLKEELTKTKASLKEHTDVVKFLKGKLNEVNLLNAKLLFTNKLFKGNNLNNDQKMKVIESFDRASTLKEVKLVYATMAETLSTAGLKKSNKAAKKITEGLASKAVGKKPEKKPINEAAVIRDKSKQMIVDADGIERLKKLAKITSK